VWPCYRRRSCLLNALCLNIDLPLFRWRYADASDFPICCYRRRAASDEHHYSAFTAGSPRGMFPSHSPRAAQRITSLLHASPPAPRCPLPPLPPLHAHYRLHTARHALSSRLHLSQLPRYNHTCDTLACTHHCRAWNHDGNIYRTRMDIPYTRANNSNVRWRLVVASCWSRA